MKRALAAIALAGCGVGGGTTTVGIWRPKHVVETDVCIHGGAPGAGCTTSTEVAHDDPARSFGGIMIEWFHPGYLHVSGRDDVGGLLALDSNVEYLRGRGAWALGLRVGGNVGTGGHSRVVYVPITALAHYGGEQWSIYAGPGYTPYFAHHRYDEDVEEAVSTHQGLNVMVGARVLLRQNRWSRITASVDVQEQLVSGGIRATSATIGFGLHL